MVSAIGWAHYVVAVVAAQRLFELWYARRNTRRLLNTGGHETGARHYPLFVVLHAAWLGALAVLVAPDPPLAWPLLAGFAVLQVLRVWVVASLGPYWTTRIITVADAPLANTGPYRLLRHPNYLIVAMEMPLLPAAFGLWRVALVFGILNLMLLYHRIKIENKALALRRAVQKADRTRTAA